MAKVRVKITDSFAVLADPRPKTELDAKYEAIRRKMIGREKPPSKATIDETINTLKKRDRYGEPMLGFVRDRGFRPDQEVLIDAVLARKWEDAGMCVVLEEAEKKPAA